MVRGKEVEELREGRPREELVGGEEGDEEEAQKEDMVGKEEGETEEVVEEEGKKEELLEG